MSRSKVTQACEESPGSRREGLECSKAEPCLNSHIDFVPNSADSADVGSVFGMTGSALAGLADTHIPGSCNEGGPCETTTSIPLFSQRPPLLAERSLDDACYAFASQRPGKFWCRPDDGFQSCSLGDIEGPSKSCDSSFAFNLTHDARNHAWSFRQVADASMCAPIASCVGAGAAFSCRDEAFLAVIKWHKQVARLSPSLVTTCQACASSHYALTPENVSFDQYKALASSVSKSFSFDLNHIQTCSVSDRVSGHRHGAPPAGGSTPSTQHAKPSKRDARLVVATYNGNSWKGAQAFLKTTPVTVVCVQEHRICGPAITEAKIWAKRNGWASYWVEAKSEAKSRSGGVALFVRAYIQSWVHPDVDPKLFAFRAVGVCIAAGHLGPVFCACCYFFTNNMSKSKIHPANLRMLGVLGDKIAHVGMPVLVGADWNMEPQIVHQIMFLDNFNLKIRSTQGQLHAGLGTCVTGGGSFVSTIDFFVMSSGLSDVVDHVRVHDAIAPRPHRPVILTFVAQP